MEESWVLIRAGRLKGLQEEMNGEISKMMDCILVCKSDMQQLAGRWTGSAAEEFQNTFWRLYQELWAEIRALCNNVSYLVMIEETLEEAEREVQSLWQEKERYLWQKG